MEVSVGEKGSSWWMLIPSGANIAAGALLGSAGNGMLQAVGGGTPLYTALETIREGIDGTDLSLMRALLTHVRHDEFSGRRLDRKGMGDTLATWTFRPCFRH
jgi:hypothetical protein